MRLLIQISGVAGGNTNRWAGRGRMRPTDSEMLTNRGQKCLFLAWPLVFTKVRPATDSAIS